jgi:SAM-dependent methyltransferase
MYKPSIENQKTRWQNIHEQLLTELTCPVCEYFGKIDNFKLFACMDIFNFGLIKRYECPKCDLIFGDFKFLTLSQEEIQKDYMDTYSYYNEATTDEFFINLFNNIPHITKNQKIIDYGSGFQLKYHEILNNTGYNVEKYDKYIKNNEMIEPQHEFYDVLFCHNLIEHVIHPINDVKEMVDLVKPGGLLIISSPCWDYCCEQTHFHTFFFIGKSFSIVSSKLNIQEIDEIRNYETIIKVFKKL